ARLIQPTPDGGLTLLRATLRTADPAAARRLVAAACLCAAGTDRPPAGERVGRLVERLRADGHVVATLAGARVEADADSVSFLREAGEAARGGLSPISLKADETAVWDGRFEVSAKRPLDLRRLAGLARRLSKPQQTALRAVTPAARPGLPVVIETDGSTASPLLTQVAGVRIEALAYA